MSRFKSKTIPQTTFRNRKEINPHLRFSQNGAHDMTQNCSWSGLLQDKLLQYPRRSEKAFK